MAKDSGVPPKHAYVNVTISVIESNIEGTTQPTPDTYPTLSASNAPTTTPHSMIHNTNAGITDISTGKIIKGRPFLPLKMLTLKYILCYWCYFQIGLEWCNTATKCTIQQASIIFVKAIAIAFVISLLLDQARRTSASCQILRYLTDIKIFYSEVTFYFS
jgi:hypothetical protein